MTCFVIKSIDINPEARTVRAVVADTNDYPRAYGEQDPLANGTGFDEWVDTFANQLFGGYMLFHPACEDKAHEAYLKTCEKLGGDFRYAVDERGLRTVSPEYREFKQEWVDTFKGFLFDGQRDERKFVVKFFGRPIEFGFRLDEEGELHIVPSQSSGSPAVGYIQMRMGIGCLHSDDATYEEVAA